MLGYLLGLLTALISIVLLSPFLSAGGRLGWVQDNLVLFQTFGSLAVACSALIAFFLYRETRVKNASEQRARSSELYLKEAVHLLEKSYLRFLDEGRVETPRNDRALWLTVARMILRYKKVKDLVTEPYHKIVLDEHEEYWRYGFYKQMRQPL